MPKRILARKRSHRKKKRLGNYPNFVVVLSLTLSLSVIGILGLLILHAKKLSDIIKENIELHVYLENDITEANVSKLKTVFSAKPYIKTKKNTPLISYISKEAAIKSFINETGEDFTEILDVSPIKSAFILKISDEFSSSYQLRKLQQEIEKVHGVFQVDFREDLVNDINKNIEIITYVLLFFSALLVLAVMVLMNNTIKLALFSQRFIIRSMQLVGATARFIQKPFIFRGAGQGLMSGIIATGFLAGLLYYAYSKIESLKLLSDNKSLLFLFGGLCLFGTFVGLFSSLRATKKYLHISLDELYK
ncbi:MAG: cell division protein FtsX [Cyclobacteriaceae bacterium]